MTEEELQVARLRRIRDLKKQELELRRDNRLQFFQPHEKQAVFFSAACYHYRYARTGNRFGKSEMGAAEDIAFALGYRPWIPEGDPLRTLGIPTHPTKGLIITTDWDKSKEVFTEIEGENKGKLIKYIPKNALGQPTKNHSGAIDRIPVRHSSGGWSVIHLDTVKSYKQNPLGQESSVWDWVHVDEPIPKGMWQAVARGLVDRGGRAWFTCTPISEPWIDEAFIPNLEDQSKANIEGELIGADSKWMMTGTMDDNPHNTTEDIERFLAWLEPEVRDARRRGLPLAYAGIVYKEFEWNIHVRSEVPPGWANWDTPPADYTKRFAIDYHPRKPHAVLFIATSPYGRQYVYNELFVSCLMSDLVDQIKEVLGPQGSTVPGLIDPLASTPNRVTDITALDEVLRLGLPVLPATKDPSNGILRVKEQLMARDRLGAPMMVFRPSIRRTLFEISRGFIWDGETNKPVKDNDDMMENLYRLCLNGLGYIEPSSDLDYLPIREIPIHAADFSNDWFDRTETVELDRRRSRQRTRYRA